MSRCKACDSVFTEGEIIWDESIKEHETLCRVCRTSLNNEDDDFILYYLDEIEDGNNGS